MSELLEAGDGAWRHESSYVDKGVELGEGTKVWHFCHIQSGAAVGRNCSLGQNVNIGSDVRIGDNVKIQNNVSVYTGVSIEDDVFLGPSCVFTNVLNPRSQVDRKSLYEITLLRRGATIGANATIVCGTTVGRYAFVAAGSVVVRDVPDYALVIGNPGRQKGWMSRHGQRLEFSGVEGEAECRESGLRYRLLEGHVSCIDLEEDAPLPQHLKTGRQRYTAYRSSGQTG